MQTQPYFAFSGVVKQRTNDGATARIVVECTPHGRRARRFADPDAKAMAEKIAAFLNAEAA